MLTARPCLAARNSIVTNAVTIVLACRLEVNTQHVGIEISLQLVQGIFSNCLATWYSTVDRYDTPQLNIWTSRQLY